MVVDTVIVVYWQVLYWLPDSGKTEFEIVFAIVLVLLMVHHHHPLHLGLGGWVVADGLDALSAMQLELVLGRSEPQDHHQSSQIRQGRIADDREQCCWDHVRPVPGTQRENEFM